MTAPDDQAAAATQRTRFQMIEAEIPGADDETLAALGLEVSAMTRLPAVERDWMTDQIEAEVRRRGG